MLPIFTVVFWAAAAVLVVAMAAYALTQSMAAALNWITGVAFWIEFRSNPEEDAERGEWTNKMLFYSIVFATTFFVGFLYWLSLYFAR